MDFKKGNRHEWNTSIIYKGCEDSAEPRIKIPNIRNAMATSLYDRPLYREHYATRSGIGDYDDDLNYDAIRDAKEKFYRNPEKYRRRHVSRHSSSHSRREITRVNVVVEHGCVFFFANVFIGLFITGFIPLIKKSLTIYVKTNDHFGNNFARR